MTFKPQKVRVGLFKLSWDVLHKDLVGVAAAMRDIVVIGANSFSDGVGYCAISVDDYTFDLFEIKDDTDWKRVPVYELKMGINPDGSRTHRWTKKKTLAPTP